MTMVTSVYPVLMLDDVPASAMFYVEHFGFEQTFATEWYVSLRHGAFELALLRHDHETVPERFRRAIGGMLLNIEVDDARAVYERLIGGAGLPLALDIRDEQFGQRHFIVEAPEGVLVDVIENIPVGVAFAEAYMAD